MRLLTNTNKEEILRGGGGTGRDLPMLVGPAMVDPVHQMWSSVFVAERDTANFMNRSDPLCTLQIAVDF